jgi:hypothetical protein
MSTNPASEPDPTTETDEALLEQAAQAELTQSSLKHTPGATEHPSGQAPPTEAPQESRYEGKAARRKPSLDD